MSEVQLDQRVVASSEVIFREIDGETVLLSLDRAEYYGLNHTGTRMWQLLQEPTRLSDVADALSREFGSPLDEVQRDTLAVARDLLQHGLIRATDVE